jgi:4'-phosphopantetheinyl transferase
MSVALVADDGLAPDLTPVWAGQAVAVCILSTTVPPRGGWPAWADRLDADERARASRLRRPADRDSFIAAHVLLRALLSTLPGMPPPGSLRFAAEPGGKPVLHGFGLGFSLSHTPGMVACALGPAETGVDLEALDRAVVPEQLAPACLTRAETAALLALSPAARPERFLRLWTLKEALVKATGEGLSRDLTGLGFGLDPPHIQEGEDAAEWVLTQFQPDARHVLALATRRAKGLAAPKLLRLDASAREGWPA